APLPFPRTAVARRSSFAETGAPAARARANRRGGRDHDTCRRSFPLPGLPGPHQGARPAPGPKPQLPPVPRAVDGPLRGPRRRRPGPGNAGGTRPVRARGAAPNGHPTVTGEPSLSVQTSGLGRLPSGDLAMASCLQSVSWNGVAVGLVVAGLVVVGWPSTPAPDPDAISFESSDEFKDFVEYYGFLCHSESGLPDAVADFFVCDRPIHPAHLTLLRKEDGGSTSDWYGIVWAAPCDSPQ